MGGAPMDVLTAKGIAAGHALRNYASRITDLKGQELRLGAKAAAGAYSGIAILVGQVSAAEGGDYGSQQRTATEEAVLDAVYDWSRAKGASKDGWHLVCTWQRRGCREAVLEVYAGTLTTMPPPVERAFQEWGDSGTLRLPATSAPGGVWVVPCKPRCSRKAPDQVLLVLNGLPDMFALKGAPDAILRAVGYPGGLRITDVFYGVDPKRPLMSDGSVCAIVTPPANDRTLALLPSSLHLGGCSANLVTVYVTTRTANFFFFFFFFVVTRLHATLGSEPPRAT